MPDVVAPVLARAISASDPWPDVPSMLLALRSVVDDLPHIDGGHTDRRSVWQAERYWLAPVGVLVAAAATLIGIALLIEQPEEPNPPARTAVATTAPAVDSPSVVTVAPAGTPAATAPTLPPSVAAVTTAPLRRVPVPLESITDFDPAGDDRVEHPERLVFINNGDPTTGWSTARYSTRDFGGLKDGVGLIIVLAPDGPARMDRLAIDSPTVDWSFEVYTSAERNRTLIDWGSPVAFARDITGSTTLDLPAVEAAALLVWITDLGDELPSGGHRVTVSRIDVSTTVQAAQGPTGTDAVAP